MEELGVCETEHSHEHQGKVELFLMGQFSHDDGPGHVCGTFIILSAGIHQVKAVLSDDRFLLLGGVVVAHSRVGSVSGDGVEAGADISLLLLS